MSEIDLSEIIKRLFDLVEKTNILTNALANVEKSLLKVEDYQVDAIKDSHEARLGMHESANAIRHIMTTMMDINKETREDVAILVQKISEIKQNDCECLVCVEKQKAVDGLKKDLDDKEKERKDDKKTLVKWLVGMAIVTASALGLNFEPIKNLLRIP